MLLLLKDINAKSIKVKNMGCQIVQTDTVQSL